MVVLKLIVYGVLEMFDLFNIWIKLGFLIFIFDVLMSFFVNLFGCKYGVFWLVFGYVFFFEIFKVEEGMLMVGWVVFVMVIFVEYENEIMMVNINKSNLCNI